MNNAESASTAQLSHHWQWAQQRMRAARNVIDLGCGPHPVEYANTGVDLFIDPDQRGCGAGEHIDISHLESRGFRFVNAALDARLPFADKEFDFAYSSHVFEHLESPEIACEEVIRIAEAGVIITPSIFADIAFGRAYHRWLMIAGADTLFFFEKLPEEDRPFGQHPNPFDILLDYGGWVQQDLDSNSRELRSILQHNWNSRSAVIEVVFPWEHSFKFHIERRRKSSIHLPLPSATRKAISAPASFAAAANTSGKNTAERKSHYMDRFPIFKLLAETDISEDDFRRSPEFAARLSAAGMWDTNLDNYWKRVQFIASSAWGSVLEIGAGCGNITRYIAANSAVSRVVAVDMMPEYLQILESLQLPKVETHLSFADKGIPIGNYDTLVLAELIEHMTLEEELTMLQSIKASLDIGANFIVTTPIGFMPDPDHVRGFSRTEFTDHLQLHYGSILRLGDNGVQQFAIVAYLGE